MNERRWEQIAAAGGIVFVVMQNIAQGLIQAGGMEPPFSAGASDVLAFFASRNPRLFGLGDLISTLSILPFLWFIAILWGRLRRAEGDLGWLSFATAACGVLSVVPILSGDGWPLAVGRVDSLTPEMAVYLFDAGNVGFANTWVALAGMLAGVAILSIQKNVLPAWLGWSAVIIALALLVARALWVSSQLIFVAYVLYSLWLIAVSIVLIRRAGH